MQNYQYYPGYPSHFAPQPNFTYFGQNHPSYHPEFPPYNPEYLESVNQNTYTIERNVPHPVQQYQGSGIIKQIPQELLSFCKQVAGLSPLNEARVTARCSSRRNRNHSKFSYVDNSININSNNRQYRTYPYSYKNKAERKRENQVQLGIISAVVIIVGSFILGSAKAERDDLENQFSEFQTIRSSWEAIQFHSNAPSHNINRVIASTRLILERRMKNNTEKTALIIAGLAAAGMVFAGAILASEALMVAGGVAGLGVGIASMYKLGYHCFSNAEKRDIDNIQREIRIINSIESKTLVDSEGIYFDS